MLAAAAARESRSSVPKTTETLFNGSQQAQFIAQSIGQAFHVAYVEFLKANGIEADQTLMKDMDYQEVLNSQEIFGDELQMFAKKENQKEWPKPPLPSPRLRGPDNIVNNSGLLTVARDKNEIPKKLTRCSPRRHIEEKKRSVVMPLGNVACLS
ncbi:unnamed protein product [Notodromas monacha]|uniref:PID domain-containing protein n=1 Tax=Notodromas monacha TaxID=399045 RepID=A0A7R9BFI5_9CRUS|nr:unnamed protein product [Notodromas monacha]CAG0914341.1 unnamed protein product [Notodromas monacha]